MKQNQPFAQRLPRATRKVAFLLPKQAWNVLLFTSMMGLLWMPPVEAFEDRPLLNSLFRGASVTAFLTLMLLALVCIGLRTTKPPSILTILAVLVLIVGSLPLPFALSSLLDVDIEVGLWAFKAGEALAMTLLAEALAKMLRKDRR